MKTKDSNEDAGAVGYEMPKIHSLWRALEQGLFPFMMNEVGVLTPNNKQFVAVCEAVVKTYGTSSTVNSAHASETSGRFWHMASPSAAMYCPNRFLGIL